MLFLETLGSRSKAVSWWRMIHKNSMIGTVHHHKRHGKSTSHLWIDLVLIYKDQWHLEHQGCEGWAQRIWLQREQDNSRSSRTQATSMISWMTTLASSQRKKTPYLQTATRRSQRQRLRLEAVVGMIPWVSSNGQRKRNRIVRNSGTEMHRLQTRPTNVPVNWNITSMATMEASLIISPLRPRRVPN